MLQYLLNTSCLWTICLIIYSLCFRKESYHAFNRYFLLVSAIAGTIIPFISWESTATGVDTITTVRAIQQATVIKRQAVETFQPQIVYRNSNWIWYIYLAGVIISFTLIVKEILTIIRLYRTGIKSKELRFALVETQKQHSPFSILGFVFITSKERYIESELKMILAHEEKHIRYHHSIDLLLLNILKIVFWFNPLIYWFNKQLQLVHEYQADSDQQTIADYGKFLLAQILLQRTPRISHSFFHSPIKNRIMMLSKSSKPHARLKQLIVLPLLILAIALFSNCNNNVTIPTGDYAIKKNGDVATYKGNTIKMKITPPDSIGNTWADRPLSLNGEKVYSVYSDMYKNDVDLDTDPVFSVKNKTLKEYIFELLKDDFDKLPDGSYNLILSLGVVDAKGELVWYIYGGVQTLGVAFDDISQSYHHEFDDKVLLALYNAPKFTPATVNGKAVPAEFSISGDKYDNIEVKNHHASLGQSIYN